MRGRGNGGGNGGNGGGRKGPNPLTRTFESNGPDVKVRGTALHIAEKYQQLARDAQVSGDRVMSENYFQHAEHYLRIVAAAQPASSQPAAALRNDDAEVEADPVERSERSDRGDRSRGERHERGERSGHGHDRRDRDRESDRDSRDRRASNGQPVMSPDAPQPFIDRMPGINTKAAMANGEAGSANEAAPISVNNEDAPTGEGRLLRRPRGARGRGMRRPRYEEAGNETQTTFTPEKRDLESPQPGSEAGVQRDERAEAGTEVEAAVEASVPTQKPRPEVNSEEAPSVEVQASPVDSDDSVMETPSPAPRKRGRPPKKKVAADEENAVSAPDASENGDEVKAKAVKPKTRRAPKARKVEAPEVETEASGASEL